MLFQLPKPITSLNGPLKVSPMVGRFREVLLFCGTVNRSHWLCFSGATCVYITNYFIFLLSAHTERTQIKPRYWMSPLMRTSRGDWGFHIQVAPRCQWKELAKVQGSTYCLLACMRITSWQHLRSYQDWCHIVTVCTHSDLILLRHSVIMSEYLTFVHSQILNHRSYT